MVSNVVNQASARVSFAAVELEEFRTAMVLSIVGELLLLAAVPLAWMVIRGITQGILQRPSVPAQAPAA